MRIRRRGRDHYVLLSAEPKNSGRDEHEDTGNAERERRPERPQKDRHQERGKERSKVDHPVESVEHHFRAMLVSLIELVAYKRRDAWFDSAGPERDQA